MKQLVFIHGGSAYSQYDDFITYLQTSEMRNPNGVRPERWSDTLRRELGPDWDVFTPVMPNKENAKYLEWKIWFERHFPFLHNSAVLVGWSQGGWFLTKYLIENTTPFTVKALYLVGAPFESEDFGGEDGGDFAFDTSRAGELSVKVASIHIIHSKDDFVVPYTHARKYQEAIPKATLTTYSDRGHFLQSEFPELIKSIQSC
jgi:uncharacterized protein